MDRRSWLWRRKSSEKSPGETESSGSFSSLERFSDDQEVSRSSPVSASPNNAQSPDVSSKIVSHEVNESVKSLNEKLSAALFSISAKEDLVKQHSKVAEEAVAGWEKAENEVADLKQQLEAASKKNSALQERIGHLDGALKECVRQLRQSREEQEQVFQETLTKKNNEWESQKLELESRVTELQSKLEAKRSEATISDVHDFQFKLQALEKENSTLKAELLATFDNLQMKTLESELSAQAAETASKQHLDSIRKVAKLEAECRRLRASVKKSSPFKDNKLLPNSICVESLTDSQSDSGERLFGVDNELSRSDSWASALIAELDQFKNDKVPTTNHASSVEIDLMDDFLVMERLASLPEANHVRSGSEIDAHTDLVVAKEHSSRAEFEALQCKMGALEDKYNKMRTEKLDMEMALAETRNQLKFCRDHMISTEDKLIELQQQLNSANGSKHAFEMKIEALESRKKDLESQLKTKNLEVKKLRERVGFLEGKSAEFATKCQNMETLTLKREQLEAQLTAAHKEAAKLQEKVDLLGRRFEEERALSAKLAAKCQKMDAIEAENMGLESKLISEQLEGEELQGKITLLVGKLEEQKALSEEFTAKLHALEEQRDALSCQLDASHMKAGKLQEKTKTLEMEVEAQRALLAEFTSKAEALEVKEEKLSSLLQLAHLEAGKLGEKVRTLEKEIEAERILSSGLAAKCKHLESLEANREEIESQLSSARIQVGELCQKASILEQKVEEQKELHLQLESANFEIRQLHEKVNSLEKEIERERKLSAEFSIKCQSLEGELSRMKQRVVLHQPVGSLEEMKIKQEAEFAVAAGKLAECQNTIASLSRQLKSLADFDHMLEFEEPELDDKENVSIANRSYILVQN